MPEPEDKRSHERPEEGEPGVLKPAPSPRPVAPRRGGIGLKIPGYHIEGVIGRGSTGTVYRARQENVDREVALKVLHKELTGRPRMVRRLQREARTTARLAHPHIVSAIDMGRTGERWWFAMELVDGPSLALLLRQEGRLSEREALRLFIPLCEALVHIWENGVVHRDIKPANILIDKVSGARLADLGLAFADDDPHLTGSEGTLGTPHYISPEQARDPSSVDIRTDIWSFGATLFHAVCGEPPLRGANVAEVLSGVLYGRVPDPLELEPDLSRGLSLVLRKCLSRDFERRYQTPRELLRDLERVRERRKPKVRAASLEPTSGAGGSVPRAVFAASMVGVVALGAFLLWKRPWESGDGHQVYAPLAELELEFERGAVAPGALLTELEEMGGELPAADLDAWRGLLSSVRDARDEVLEELESETEERFERNLLAGDFGAAKVTLGSELERLLVERAGVALESAPSEFRLRIVGLEHRLDRAVDGATARLRSELSGAFADPFMAEVDALIQSGRWRSANERLAVSPEELPGELGVDLSSLPMEKREALVAQFGTRLVNARADLDRRWGLFDDELVRWIDLAARDLKDELSRDLEPISAGARLRDAFEQELARRGVSREELLVEPQGLARRKLAEAASELEDLEARVTGAQDAGESEALDSLMAWVEESAVGGLFRERRYRDVRDYWKGRKAWLAENGSVATPRWAELEARVDSRLAECELLIGLAERAASGLARRDGEELDLHMSPEVLSPGTLLILAPGPEGGMSFAVGKRRVYDLFIEVPRGGLPRGARLLEAGDVEAFGLVGLDPAMARLTRAFFRYREGDLDTAYALLSELEPRPPWGQLAGEIVRSVERTRSARAEAEARRLSQARSLMATLYLDDPSPAERLRRDPGRAIVAIDRLLGDFGDLELVSGAADELRALKLELRSPSQTPDLAAFEAAFGEGVVSFPSEDVVELDYDFSYDEGHSFSPGAWQPDGAGWLSPGDIASDEDLLKREAPRLVLRRPLDIDRGPVTCRLEFTEPFSTGDERLIVVSVAGFDFLMQTPAGSSSSTVAAGVRGPERLLADLRSGGGEAIPRVLLGGGKTHTLELEFDRRRGQLLVRMDGLEVLQRELTSPLSLDKPGSYGLTMRAREQVRLVSARVSAAR